MNTEETLKPNQIKKQRRMVTIHYNKDGKPLVLTNKQGRNDICLGKDCRSSLKVKNCNCEWATYCKS